MRTGWFNESYRHSLAARGVRTHYYSGKRRYLAEISDEELSKLRAEAASSKANKAAADELYRQKEAEAAARAAAERKLRGERSAKTRFKRRSEMTPEQKAYAQGARETKATLKDTTGKTSPLKRQREEQRTRRLISEEEQRYLQKERFAVVDAIKAGALADIYVDGQRMTLKEALDELQRTDTGAYNAALAQLQTSAVEYETAGLEFPSDLQDRLTTSTKSEISRMQKQKSLEAEGGLKRFVRRETTALPGDILAGEKAVFGGAAEGRKELLAQEERPLGAFGAYDDIKASPLFSDNPLLGTIKPAPGGPLRTVRGTESLTGTVGDFLKDDAIRLDGKPLKPEAEYVEKEVESLWGARQGMAKVDLAPYKKGVDAFEKGDREELLGAINDLQSQEMQMADRWNLVEQTRTSVLTPKHRASAYHERGDGSFTWLMGGDGANRLVEQTKKVNEVKRLMKRSANDLYHRRKMLQYRLARMDAKIPPDVGAPSARRIVRIREDAQLESGKDPVDFVNPVKVIPEVFEKKTPAEAKWDGVFR